jgi:hypothetical protein
MTARRSATETEIPLYLIPTVIARQIIVKNLKFNTNVIDLTEFPLPFPNSTPHNQFRFLSCRRFKVLDYKLHGGVVHRISVKRTGKHHYNITVRTKSLNREFKIRNQRAQLFADDPVEDMSSNEDSGSAT